MFLVIYSILLTNLLFFPFFVFISIWRDLLVYFTYIGKESLMTPSNGFKLHGEVAAPTNAVNVALYEACVFES